MIKTFTQLLLLINFVYMPLVNAGATTSDLIFKHSYKLISSKIHFADSVNILYKDNQDEYTFEVSSRTAGISKQKKISEMKYLNLGKYQIVFFRKNITSIEKKKNRTNNIRLLSIRKIIYRRL